jgi:hypothetical protein
VKYRVQIPEDMLDDKIFYVVVKSALALKAGTENELWCMNPEHEKAWVVLHNSSFFHTPHDFTELRDFHTFPAVFLGEQGLDPVKVVLPNDPSRAEYETAMNVLYSISSNVPYDVSPHFEILRESEMTPDLLEQSNMILIGRVESKVPDNRRNNLLVEANSKLPLPLNLENGRPTKTRIEILPEFLNETAVVQLAKSPWNEKKYILALSASNEVVLEDASRMFINRAISSEWQGNITLVNDKGQWYSYAYGIETGQEKRSYLQKYLAIWAGCAVLVVFVIAILWYWRRKHGFKHNI